MPDNVQVAALTVASKEVGAGATSVQHQRIIPETVSAGVPMDVATTAPIPVWDERNDVLLEQILVELRVHNELLFGWVNPPSETLDSMRVAARVVPFV